jgi:hypothetical protein
MDDAVPRVSRVVDDDVDFAVAEGGGARDEGGDVGGGEDVAGDCEGGVGAVVGVDLGGYGFGFFCGGGVSYGSCC